MIPQNHPLDSRKSLTKAAATKKVAKHKNAAKAKKAGKAKKLAETRKAARFKKAAEAKKVAKVGGNIGIEKEAGIKKKVEIRRKIETEKNAGVEENASVSEQEERGVVEPQAASAKEVASIPRDDALSIPSSRVGNNATQFGMVEVDSPMKILSFGGCQLSYGLTPLWSSQRIVLTTHTAGINSSTYTMSEKIQRIRFVRGDVEVPEHLRYYCNLPTNCKAGSETLRLLEQADVVLLEPNTTFEMFLGPYALHRSQILTGFLNTISDVSEELRAAGSAWFNVGLFGQDRDVQLEAAEILIPALHGRVENEAVARQILLEARAVEQSFGQYLDSIGEFCDMVDLPIGLVTFVHSFLPDGRPMGWPADFIENTSKIAGILELPTFDSALMVNRYGVDICLDERRMLYRKEFWPVLADEYLKFSSQLLDRRKERRKGVRFSALALDDPAAPTEAIPPLRDAPVMRIATAPPLRGDNLYGDTSDLGNGAWGVYRSQWGSERASGPGGIVGWKLLEAPSLGTHDFRRGVQKDGVQEDYVLSFMVKPDERSQVQVWMGSETQANRARVSFELMIGQVAHIDTHGTGWKSHSAGLVSLEDGWWWCWMAAQTDDTTRLVVLIAFETADGDIIYEGDGHSGAWFGNIRLERGQVPTLAFDGAMAHGE